MKNIFKYLMLAVVAVFGLSLTSCNDDDTNLSRKVLASVSVLEYDGEAPGVELITITSDGDWYVEAPEWITVTPSKGSVGQTEVEITVAPNYRDGLLDNPRKVTILFKGRNLESIASVIVRQNGDKFRDPIDYTFDDLNGIEDETVVNLPNIVVTALTGTGFVATDGTDYMYVSDAASPVAVGDKVSVIAEKFTNTMNVVYVKGDKITNEGTGVIPSVEPTDISATLDNMSGTKYQYVTFTGDVEGSSIIVGDNVCKAYFVDPSNECDLSKFGGHKVTVKGYYAGIASPMVNIIPAEIEDLGINEVVYFTDDFEWLDPWAAAAGAKDYIAESETLKAQSINLDKTAEDGTKLMDVIMKEHGYGFVKATGNRPNKTYEDRPFETRIYLQRNYLKFGLTGIEAGIVLPSIKGIPAGEKCELLFDWSPMRQGDPGAKNRKYDDVHLVVVVDNNGIETQVPVPPHTLAAGDAHAWMHAAIDLSDLTINENTKITLRARDEQWPNYKLPADDPNDKGECAVNRWFFDNVKLRQKK